MRLRLAALLLTVLMTCHSAPLRADSSEQSLRAGVQLFLDDQLEEALAVLNWRSTAGSPEGQLLAGVIYVYAGEEWRSQARDQLLRSAGQGNAAAMLWLGLLSFQRGCAECLMEAEKWLGQAARTGDRDARKILIATHYWQGRFSEADEQEAEALMADRDDLAALHSAIILARWLKDQPEQRARAMDLYRRAAEQGDAEAQYALYAHLQEHDGKEAAIYLAMASLQGFGAAISVSLPPDAEEAGRARLSRIAADQGTALGRAAAWCAKNGADYYPNCQVLALAHHERCFLPQSTLHALEVTNFEESRFYSNCRWTLLREQSS